MRALGIAAHLLLLGSLSAVAQTKPTETARLGAISGTKISLEDSPCCGESKVWANPEIMKSDQALIIAMHGRVSRDGKVLRLRVDGNRTLKITDCDDVDACGASDIRVHRLVAWWPERRYYVINVGTYEGGLAYLIRELDGLVISTAAPPLLSPDRQYAIAVGELFTDSAMGIDVLDLRSDPPKVVGGNSWPEACPDHINWIGDAEWTSSREVLFKNTTLLTTSQQTAGRITMRIVPHRDIGSFEHPGESALWQCSK